MGTRENCEAYRVDGWSPPAGDLPVLCPQFLRPNIDPLSRGPILPGDPLSRGYSGAIRDKPRTLFHLRRAPVDRKYPQPPGKHESAVNADFLCFILLIGIHDVYPLIYPDCLFARLTLDRRAAEPDVFASVQLVRRPEKGDGRPLWPALFRRFRHCEAA